ncbi:hypothetical protein [Glycomyces algeriensis]|uniref:Uncharacterized protein n=1 Tax=Glycomyces algeriensis TaxID=256037 RepID=A0A9W6LIB4_9ACTN|nr:hypothetical protein [Glycomyces algeriensis]MDA1364764.1 hypothetical protein [Glycomyces algeriensis]MDR7350805.1 hypothetical protein [Glycomyces algeriensis]GLI43516.1 hypothetical protein GALLR39Z86_33660 [Glycomyces algeriensis]
MNEHEWPEVIGAIGMFALLIGVVLSLIWRSAFIKRVKLQYRHDDQYKELAAKAQEGQVKIAEQLAVVNERLARIEAGNASIEETLKVVE